MWSLIKAIKDQNSFNPGQKDEYTGTNVSFKDVGGCEKAKTAIRQRLDYLKRPGHYRKLGVKMQQGVLLFGKPGTGKTLMAKAAATEANIPFLYASGSEFVNKYVG